MCLVRQSQKRNLPGAKIAQHFSAGMLRQYTPESCKGRQNRVFRPSRDFPAFCHIHPSAKALGYFRDATQLLARRAVRETFLTRNALTWLVAVLLCATTSLGQKP